MSKRPQNAKFRFYKKLKLDKDFWKAIKFFNKWKKVNSKEIRK